MTRLAVLLIALAACKKHRTDHPVPGVNDLSVGTSHDSGGYSIDVDYTVLLDKAPPMTHGVSIRAACQVGHDRLVEVGAPRSGGDDQISGPDVVVGEPRDIADHPFVTHELPARPTMCDLEFHAGAADGPVIDRRCWRDDDTIVRAECPANPVPASTSPTGLVVAVTQVTPEEGDGTWPAHLTVEYRATATKDMPKGAYLVRETACAGSTDMTWHDELSGLRAGETIWEAQNTNRIGNQINVDCVTRLGLAPFVNGPVTWVKSFCHRNARMNHCPE